MASGHPEAYDPRHSILARAPAVTASVASDSTTSSQPRRGLIRRLYDWVLSWADSRHGLTALAVISFAESSFFPIPPDVLQIALSVAKPKLSYLYAAVSAVASVAGGVAGWAIGWGLWHLVSEFFFDYVPGFSHDKFEYVESLYKNNAFASIFAAAFTPIPYKIFTIAAGVFSVPLGTLVLASALGRSTRFFLVATVMRFFGAHAKALLDRYLELATLALGVLLIGGFLVIRWLMPSH
jgi:membrane protein YqaA with SNARE-associated domain